MQRRTELWLVGIFVIVVVAAVIAAAVLGGGGSSATPASQQGFKATLTAPITSSDWQRGDANAKVSIIEYGDFQCPACGAYEPLVEQLEKQYATSTLWVFRNFPLTELHPNAMIAAEAAEAAGLQGKYWEMHDLLYKNQNIWADTPTDAVVQNYFDKYAISLGLDVQKFNTDINSAAVKQKIATDVASANAAQVDHTPTFFIDLRQIPNPTSLQQFQADINAALASSTAQ